MKIYLTLYIILTSIITMFGQDTLLINLDVNDTTLYQNHVQINGTTYSFKNRLDTAYLDLEPQVSWTLHVYKRAECYPQYQFKSNMPDGVYYIYNESLLVETVQFKNHKRIGKSQKFEYKVVDEDLSWMNERISRIGYHGACDVKENTYKLVVYKTAINYQNGEVKRRRRSVYLGKQTLCKYRYNREKKKSVSYLNHREIEKRFIKKRKVRKILF